MRIKVERLCRMPLLPNYIVMDDSDQKISIADISDDVLRAIGKAWTEALIAHAQARRQRNSL